MTYPRILCMAFLASAVMASPAAAKPDPSRGRMQQCHSDRLIGAGKASWYGPGFHGRRTANGEIFNMYALTAAHRTLPLGTRVLVENPENGESLVVRINDRGPYIQGRVLDLSKQAADRLGMVEQGVAKIVMHRCI